MDFYGLPSNPVCIYRTGDEWHVPKGPQAQRLLREARPICKHPIQDVWPTLGKEIYEFLDSLEVKWSTIDPVRFAEKGGEVGPLHLWIGVKPKSLSFKDAKTAAIGCKGILANAQFPDIEIAFWESIYISSAGPQLFDYGSIVDPINDICSPFTPALGIPIAPKDTPHFEGTGALYLRESSQNERVFLLTAHHVALPPPAHKNELYVRKTSQCPHEVVILGTMAYMAAIEGMMKIMDDQKIVIETYNRELGAMGEAAGDSAIAASRRRVFQDNITKAEAMIVDIDEFHDKITKYWTTLSQRIFGYVLYSPPIPPLLAPSSSQRTGPLLISTMTRLTGAPSKEM